MTELLDKLIDEGRVAAGDRERLARSLCERPDPGEADCLRWTAERYGIRYSDLHDEQPDPALLSRFAVGILSREMLLPLRETGQGIEVATSALFRTEGFDALRRQAGEELTPVLVPEEILRKALQAHLGVGADTLDSMGRGRHLRHQPGRPRRGPRGGRARRLHHPLREPDSHRRPAPAHHRHPSRTLRGRVPRALPHRRRPAGCAGPCRHEALPAGHRLARQDPGQPGYRREAAPPGRANQAAPGREPDRCARVGDPDGPTARRWCCVCSAQDGALRGLDQLAMGERELKLFRETLGLSHGIVLVTGPTGSGKTTTLYAALQEINDSERKIITIEDPRRVPDQGASTRSR